MDEIRKAKYSEWLASTIGACLVSFGAGIYLAGYFTRYLPWIVLVGAVMHGFGMYKIHIRNK